MRYTPAPRKGKAMVVAGILFAIGAVSYIFSLAGIASALALQLITMASIVCATYVLVRFAYTSITYVISPRDGLNSQAGIETGGFLPCDVDFIVQKSQGRREGVTECRISLDQLTETVALPRGRISGNLKKDIRDRYGAAKYYIYTVSFRPDEALGLIFDDDGEISVIVIEPDEATRFFLENVIGSGATRD